MKLVWDVAPGGGWRQGEHRPDVQVLLGADQRWLGTAYPNGDWLVPTQPPQQRARHGRADPPTMDAAKAVVEATACLGPSSADPWRRPRFVKLLEPEWRARPERLYPDL